MATAERSSTARRTARVRKPTTTTTRTATAATGTKPAPATGRRSTSAETGRRRQSRTSATAPIVEATPAEPTQGRNALLRRTSVAVPVVNVRVPLLSPRVPGMGAVAAQTRWATQTVRANLPPVERMLYYGGLGLLVAAGTLEWPVAAAVGVGVWVAGRTGQHHRGRIISA